MNMKIILDMMHLDIQIYYVNNDISHVLGRKLSMKKLYCSLILINLLKF